MTQKLTINMNKTTLSAAKCFKNGKKFRFYNTIVNIADGYVYMKLHGHIIASRKCRTNSPIILNDKGWRSNITKDRLNGLLAVYGVPLLINSTKGTWWLKGKNEEHMWKAGEDNIFETNLK